MLDVKQMLTLSDAGRKGGKKRAAILSKARLVEIATMGGKARQLKAKQERCQKAEKGENKVRNNSSE